MANKDLNILIQLELKSQVKWGENSTHAIFKFAACPIILFPALFLLKLSISQRPLEGSFLNKWKQEEVFLTWMLGQSDRRAHFSRPFSAHLGRSRKFGWVSLWPSCWRLRWFCGPVGRSESTLSVASDEAPRSAADSPSSRLPGPSQACNW